MQDFRLGDVGSLWESGTMQPSKMYCLQEGEGGNKKRDVIQEPSGGQIQAGNLASQVQRKSSPKPECIY